MKLNVPSPTAAVRHRDDHAVEVLAGCDDLLARIDGDLDGIEPTEREED